MDLFEFAFVLVATAVAAALTWAEWRKMRREDALHEVRVERERLECRKLAREIETAATTPAK